MKTLLWMALVAGALAPAIGQTAPPAAAPQPAAATVKVALTTAQGRIVIELDKARAPITTANFLRYVDQKRFDGVFFYRASNAPGFPDIGFLQAGTANDPKRTLPPIAHEPTSKTGLKHEDGTISMARLAPGTARGDWIITLGPQPYLDADPARPGDNQGNAAFGRVIEGMDVVRAIHKGPRGADAANPVMKGEMLEPKVRIVTARRVP